MLGRVRKMGYVKNYYHEEILKMDEFQDDFEYQGPKIKAVAWWGGAGWHVQVEGYPINHGDSFLSPVAGLPNGYLETWAKCRPWFDIRKEE